MNERISKLRYSILSQEHHKYRRRLNAQWGDEFAAKGLSPLERSTERIVRMHLAEQPVILPGERLLYTRTVESKPDIAVASADIQEISSPLFSKAEWAEIKLRHFIHFTGDINNLCPRYEYLLNCGTMEKAEQIRVQRKEFEDSGNFAAVSYMDALLRVLGAINELAGRYRLLAEETGHFEASKTLANVPFHRPNTFFEALQFLRILNFTLYLSGNHHNSLGRLDQYLYPFFKNDMDNGSLNSDTALELIEEFFLSLNKDTDLYYGMQYGDNGQSVTLGGKDQNGRDTYNELSELCLLASLDLGLIDPKLNIRVHKNTAQSVLNTGSRLTRQGLGFPQYSNDDIVVPALIKKGYATEDAYDYAIAACWEYIIPGKGAEIVDIEAVSMPRVLDDCLHQNLSEICSYETLMSCLKRQIELQKELVLSTVKNIFIVPSPAFSLLMYRCIEDAKDISQGNVYNNYGVVATGISTIVDSISAIRKKVFDEKLFSLQEVLKAVDVNFEGYDDIHAALRYDAPKFGNDDPYADEIAVDLLNIYADAMEACKNERDGLLRPGTGSAMYYIWHPREMGASPDGRLKGEPFSANYSPSLNAKLKGPISVLRSFSKPDMLRMMNGGPITLELSDTSLRGAEGVEKLAHLVRFFIDAGAQQMQLNAVNAEKLRSAMENPDAYKQLIVRVWGWSGYFIQLDEAYQKQILQRCEFAL